MKTKSDFIEEIISEERTYMLEQSLQVMETVKSDLYLKQDKFEWVLAEALNWMEELEIPLHETNTVFSIFEWEVGGNRDKIHNLPQSTYRSRILRFYNSLYSAEYKIIYNDHRDWNILKEMLESPLD